MGGKKLVRVNISDLVDAEDTSYKSKPKVLNDDSYIPLDDENNTSKNQIDLYDEYEQIDEEEDELDNEYTQLEEDVHQVEEKLDFGKKIRDYYQDQSSSDEEFEEKLREAKKLNDDLYRNVTEESADMLNISAEAVELSKVLKDIFKSDHIDGVDKIGDGHDVQSTIPLSSEDRSNFLEKIHPEFIALINDLHNNVNHAYDNILPLLNSAKYNKFCTPDGMEFLDLRNELILIYMTYFTYYMLIKANGNSVKGHPVIERLLEIRLILDKIKPIESRLGYEISKLVEIANNPELAKTVIQRAKPNMLVTNDDESESESDVSSSDSEYADKEIEPSYITDKHSKTINSIDKELSKQESRLKYSEYNDDDSDTAAIDNEMREFMQREKIEQDKMMRVFSNKSQSANKRPKDTLQDLSSFADNVISSNVWEKLKVNKKLKDHHTTFINAGLNTLSQIGKQNKISIKKKFTPDLPVKVKTQKPQTVGNLQVDSKSHKQHSKPDTLDLLSNELKKDKVKKIAPIIKEDTSDGSRGVTHEILKNKGLTRKRKKGHGNARVSNRNKYEKSLKKIGKKSSEVVVDYTGESTGINAKVKKSISIK